VLFSYASDIFSRTRRVHLSQLGEARRIITMSKFFYLGYVVIEHEEIKIVLDQFTEISTERVMVGTIQ